VKEDSVDYMLTTVDNPHNPNTHWDEWYAYDTANGHHTVQFLARIAKISDSLSEADEELAIEQAMDEIIRENVSGVYRKIAPDGTFSMDPTTVAD
jgi:hypothetical protein